MLNKIIFGVFITSIATFSFPQISYAALKCEALDGNWVGTMRGKFNGKTTMTIKNCRLNWKLPDGRTNRCRFKERKNEIRYSCGLGSKGVVTINGNRIIMRNIFTANRHGKYTVKGSLNANLI